jgi:hypothetical protein
MRSPASLGLISWSVKWIPSAGPLPCDRGLHRPPPPFRTLSNSCAAFFFVPSSVMVPLSGRPCEGPLWQLQSNHYSCFRTPGALGLMNGHGVAVVLLDLSLCSLVQNRVQTPAPPFTGGPRRACQWYAAGLLPAVPWFESRVGQEGAGGRRRLGFKGEPLGDVLAGV